MKNILFGTENPKSLVMGVALAIIVVVMATYAGGYIRLFLNLEKSPISTIMLAIILGIVIKNTAGVSQAYNPGIKFCLKKVLRLGIILLGTGLSIFAVIKVGILTIGIVAVCITSGLLIIYFISKRLKLDGNLGVLIGVGTGICGATAIVATGPVINARDEEIAYAVATITVFGIMAMFTYPYLTHLLALTDIQAGIVMGTGVHETSQVAGAALIYDQLWDSNGSISGGNVAIITKLMRNTFLAIVIPLISFLYLRRGEVERGKKINPLELFPTFIAGFILMAVIRSIGDYLIVNEKMLWDHESWSNLLALMKHWSATFLAIAMAGIGLGTDIKELKNLGLKPFFAGLLGATSVGIIGFILVVLLASFLIL